MSHDALKSMNPGFCANVKFVHAAFRKGTAQQISSAKEMLKILVRSGAMLKENRRIEHMQYMRKAMHEVWGFHEV